MGDIATAVNASPSLVSHHLRLLRGARLVRGTRRNRQVFYQAADEHIAHMLTDMIEHAMEEQGADSDT
ncbi:HTH-type transcriptional repressor SmtB [compost metagenome]